MTQLRKWLISLLFLSGTVAVAQNRVPAASFFAGLDSLKAGKDTVISIVHLGDSHIQAGFLTGQVMRLFQERFGNAGRGWVAPYKLGRSNQPTDYFITSDAREWIYGRCIQNTRKCPIGIGGVGVQNAASSLDLSVGVKPGETESYEFCKAIVYRGESSAPLAPASVMRDSADVAFSRTPSAPGVLADTIRLQSMTTNLNLHTEKRQAGAYISDKELQNLYFGFTLINEKPGVLYHSVGVNGAMYVNYTTENYVRQLALLNPDLLIVSLGTNETFGKRFNITEFTNQIRNFITLVRQHIPDAAILLTTPPECYKQVWVDKKKVYVRNDNSEKAARAIVGFAEAEGLGCWDLFSAAGGKNSSKEWFSKGWMGRDRVHFKPAGYEKQGRMLFEALMDMYNSQSNNQDAEQ